MEIYDVKLAEGVVVRVKADNPEDATAKAKACLLYTSPSPRD